MIERKLRLILRLILTCVWFFLNFCAIGPYIDCHFKCWNFPLLCWLIPLKWLLQWNIICLCPQSLFINVHPVHFLNSRSHGIGVKDTAKSPYSIKPHPSPAPSGGGDGVGGEEVKGLFVEACCEGQQIRDLLDIGQLVSHWVSAEVVSSSSAKVGMPSNNKSLIAFNQYLEPLSVQSIDNYTIMGIFLQRKPNFMDELTKHHIKSNLGYPSTFRTGTYPDKRYVRIWELCLKQQVQ